MGGHLSFVHDFIHALMFVFFMGSLCWDRSDPREAQEHLRMRDFYCNT